MHIRMRLKSGEAKRIGRELDARRIEFGLTHKELGEKIGTSQSQVSRICAGRFVSLGYNVMQICIALGVDIPGNRSSLNADEQRLTDGILKIWDQTSADADRLLRLLESVGEVRKASARPEVEESNAGPAGDAYAFERKST